MDKVVKRVSLSPAENRQLRLCRMAVAGAPMLAGIATPALFFAILSSDIQGTGLWPPVVVFTNIIAAAAGAAFAVLGLHPVERGKWWRTGAAFLFSGIFSYVLAAGALMTLSRLGAPW